MKHGPRLQDPVLARPDELAFVGPPFEEPLAIRGAATVVLSVATSGADSDFAVRLTEVNEEGMHLLVADGIRRLKLRKDFSQVSPVVPQERYSIEIDLVNEIGYVFSAGHRVGLVVSSSNWPRFERNPNNGQDFYSDAASSVSVSNTLFLDGSCQLLLSLGQ